MLVSNTMNKIKLTKYYIEINAQPSDPDLLELCKHIQPVVHMRTANTYRCSLSFIPEVLRIMRGIRSIDTYTLDDSVRQLYQEELIRRARTADLKRCGPDKLYDGLWEHQSLGVCLAECNRRYNFFYDTRTGKTRMAYQIMLNALKSGKAKRCLVLAPSAIIPDWLADAKYFPELKVAAYYKDDKTKRTALAQPTHVLIWSEGMFASALKFIETIGFDICFFDESSKLKSYKSQVSKAAIDLSLHIPSWYNLSATPAPNGEWEYYVQMQTVDPYLFSSYTTHFHNRYFDDLSTKPQYHKWKMKEELRTEFMERVNSRSIYVDQRVMPTAEKHWHVVQFPLQDRTWDAYSCMAKSMALEVGDHEITAAQSVAMRAKLNQIASGFVLDTDAISNNKLYHKLGLQDAEQEIYYVGNGERLSMLRRLLQAINDKEPGAQVIIWANYKAEFTMLRELFDRAAGYVNGDTSIIERERTIKLFRQGALKYLVAHPLSIGMGINLTVSHHAIYYSLNDSWEALKQSSERIMGHIDVQPHDVHYYMLLAYNTVNGIIYENLMNKRDASLGLLEHLKAVAKDA